MRDNGLSEEELFSFLSLKRREDTDYGNILSSMCTVPHPVAVRAHRLFIETNLGDPGLFAGTASLEAQLIALLADLYHHPGACGYATSGGTESNIQALRIARSRAGQLPGNIVLPESAHFSFKKACEILNLEMRLIPLDDQFRMDPGGVEDAIDDHTCCLVGIAGTTEYGMVDPIRHLGAIAARNDIFFHVDAAFGGMVLPFMDGAAPFDFSVPGVSSIAVDPHKMGMSTIPAGCLLVRDPEMICSLSIDTPYLTVKQEFTLSGTRPGAPVVAALAVLEYLGRDGMTAIVEGCMKNTRRIIDGMEAYGIPRVVTPDVNVATFSTDLTLPPPWQVSRTRQGHLRIVCMPHVHRSVVEAFLQDIGDYYA